MSFSIIRRRSSSALILLGLMTCARFGAYAETRAPILRARPTRAAICADSTSFLRQFAKDDPRTQIIVSGPQAASVAKTLYDDIKMHRDFKARPGEDKVVILTLDQAEQAAQDPKFNDNTRIFLLATRELKGGLSAALARTCAVDLAQLPEGNGITTSRNLNPRAGHLAFSMAVVAPDAERLQTMMGFFSQPYPDYKGMLPPISDKFETNRLAIFSAESDREAVEKWGRIDAKRADAGNIWAKYDWYPLNAYTTLTPEQREERQFVFFLNRADSRQTVPAPAQALLNDQPLKETTSIVTKGRGPNGLPCVVFSAPSPTLLHRRAVQYDRIEAIPATPAIDDATDMRALDRSVLLVHGAGLKLTPDDAERIRSQTAQMMRDRLRIPVEELEAQFDALQKGSVFQDVTGATETAQRMREKSGVRYVWLLQVTDYGGKTVYMPSQKLTSPPPPTYAQAHPEDKEPVEPTLDIGSGRGKQAQYEKDKAAWQPLHDAWKNRKLAFDRYGETQYPFTWDCRIEKESVANVAGVLRLIDLDHPNTPLWEKACSGRRAEKSEFASRTVQVRGTKNQPAPLPSPPNDETCSPNLLQQAGIGAGSAGVYHLQATALLSDGKSTQARFQVQEKAKTADPPAVRPGSKVAYVDDSGVTLKIDPAAGIEKGFWVDIPLSVIDIPDPDNPGKILAHKVVEKVVLRVISLHDNVAECVPVSDREKAKLGRVKLGMIVSDYYSPPDKK
jgi:hypothetical protein